MIVQTPTRQALDSHDAFSREQVTMNRSEECKAGRCCLVRMVRLGVSGYPDLAQFQ